MGPVLNSGWPACGPSWPPAAPVQPQVSGINPVSVGGLGPSMGGHLHHLAAMLLGRGESEEAHNLKGVSEFPMPRLLEPMVACWASQLPVAAGLGLQVQVGRLSCSSACVLTSSRRRLTGRIETAQGAAPTTTDDRTRGASLAQSVICSTRNPSLDGCRPTRDASCDVMLRMHKTKPLGRDAIQRQFMPETKALLVGPLGASPGPSRVTSRRTWSGSSA